MGAMGAMGGRGDRTVSSITDITANWNCPTVMSCTGHCRRPTAYRTAPHRTSSVPALWPSTGHPHLHPTDVLRLLVEHDHPDAEHVPVETTSDCRSHTERGSQLARCSENYAAMMTSAAAGWHQAPMIRPNSATGTALSGRTTAPIRRRRSTPRRSRTRRCSAHR